ncbi:type ISP restriction/modification enzyme [Streptomyces justiciae]|uniref:type ISP restriction/modification enzyme n=1 Tax=Streptomyces justiciae TaxID=2780140 RepID=UPI0018802E54|nr:type ISP restriction/modification enzyme [Streptomyces justiciae]MBE8476672.1 DNA methyltransferase [Streptomyces justiciae]MCW8380965.1 DNA methyltransferase [Streptomyces justiciae]
MPSVTHDDAPLLADLMPWSVAPPRLGRGWPAGPDSASLKARWDALLKAEGPDREALFEPTRSRHLRSAVGQLPGRTGGTEKLIRATGPCPEPVRVLYAPFDEQWLIPDHRLIDTARPELWRVTDDDQVFVAETAGGGSGPLLVATSLFPLLRPGRVRPLYRRPGGAEPNLAPGLLAYLGERLDHQPSPLDVLAWIMTAIRPDLTVPLTDDPELWARGVESGHRLLWLMRRDGERPKLPGGRRPYVRAPLPSRPLTLHYDRDEETLHLDEGRISPVPPEAWDYEVAGVRVLEEWFTARTAESEPGTLGAIRPATWTQAWTSELLELITVLALLAEVEPLEEELTSGIRTADLRKAGVLPVQDWARGPASVLDGHEEGPEGQLTLL